MASFPSVRTPSVDELVAIAAEFGIRLTPALASSYRELIAEGIESYTRIDALPEPGLPVAYPRTPGHRPPPEENPYNAWYWRCEVSGARHGLLAGKTVALKDNVCLAGVPMSIGTSVLEGYVPEVDATIVTRILDAGGTIAGKAVCGAFCMEGSSFTASTGLIPNPHKPSHAAGGSSSGSAALVAAGAVDVAVGADQGGSLRIPAAWCGLYGMKPTFGLVPYSGIASIEFTLDHAGPMAANLEDMTRLLQAIGRARRHRSAPTQYRAARLPGGPGGRRARPQNRLPRGRLRAAGERAGRGRAGAGGAQALRGAWRRSQRRQPAHASGGHAHLGRGSRARARCRTCSRAAASG